MPIHSHVVFVLKNSRYDFEKIMRKKPVGYIAPTYPFLEGKEEEILVEVLCNIAMEINLVILSMNFCGDHVHALIISETKNLSKIMMLWKGKTAYVYNRRLNPEIQNLQAAKSDGTKQNLWAKGYYQNVLNTNDKIESVLCYIANNRKKHSLPPLSKTSREKIRLIIRKE